MAHSTTANSKERIYKPSWIDRFTNWIENLPIREWVFYLGLGIVLILTQIIFLWVDGGSQAEVLLPVIIFNGLAIPYILALIHLFDHQAVTALNTMRPALDLAETELDNFRYKLSYMPARMTLIAGLIMVALTVLIERLSITPIRYAALEQLPIFAIVYHIIDKTTAFVFGVFIYHTIRQLTLVNTINLNHVRINLFNLGPLQAFPKLTGATAVGLIVGVYGWMLLNPDLSANPIFFGFTVLVTILAVAVFVWPLIGVHTLMEREKERTLHDINLRFEVAFTKFNQRFQDEENSAIGRLNSTISSLEIQYNRIKTIPTWPWRPETARVTLTAIALPLILRILQFLVERAFF
jgi:hypothetical protein